MSSRKSLRLLPQLCQALSNTPGGEILLGLQALGRQQLFRYCASQASESLKASTSPYELELRIRKLAPAISLQKDLRYEADLHEIIPYEKLVAMIKHRGLAQDEKEAERVTEMLQLAGFVLRHGNVVYLKPGELYDERMPDPPRLKDLEEKLVAINAELGPLEEAHQQADRLTMRLLYGGAVVLAAQLAIFWRLTYWELSWDVMEPAAYMLSVFYSLLGYLYFLGTKGHIFELKPFQDSAYGYFKGKKLKQLTNEQLDEERYQHLLKMRTIYLKRISRVKDILDQRSSARLST